MRARAAGHDRVVPVLPAAAGRAPLPRPLRYRPRVLTGGCQARACLGRAPRGLGRRAALPALRPPSPGSTKPRCWEAALGPTVLVLESIKPQAWPATLVGGPVLTPVIWRRRATVTWEGGWGRGRSRPLYGLGAQRGWRGVGGR